MVVCCQQVVLVYWFGFPILMSNAVKKVVLKFFTVKKFFFLENQYLFGNKG